MITYSTPSAYAGIFLPIGDFKFEEVVTPFAESCLEVIEFPKNYLIYHKY